jgi:hypothetical protein
MKNINYEVPHYAVFSKRTIFSHVKFAGVFKFSPIRVEGMAVMAEQRTRVCVRAIGLERSVACSCNNSGNKTWGT